jgi:phage baseplate assembly protein W
VSTGRIDYAYPLRIDGASGQAAHAPFAAHVEQMIEQILLTTAGERVDLPSFGCGLRQLVFEPFAGPLAATLNLQITQALSQWLSGVIQVSQIDVTTSDQNAALEPGTVQVTVTYLLIETQSNQQTTVTLL